MRVLDEDGQPDAAWEPVGEASDSPRKVETLLPPGILELKGTAIDAYGAKDGSKDGSVLRVGG